MQLIALKVQSIHLFFEGVLELLPMFLSIYKSLGLILQ
ncbi:hypothetical protein LEP1GSC192_1198 [Leptospira sp. B5-022]|nr:hypothetical protein LEP1GSC192_1198 [Leptospira sp. B5-022]